MSPEADLIEGALAQASEPAMERREMGRRGLRVGSFDRRAESAGTAEIATREELDHGQRERLEREEVGGEHSSPGPAVGASSQRDLHRVPPVEQDGSAADARVAQPEALLPAARAADLREKSMDLEAALIIDVLEELANLEGQHVWQRA